MPKLILKHKETEKEQELNFEREEITLGRANTNMVVLEGTGVSRLHAKIFPSGKDFYLMDLESTGGTRLNGILIPKNEKYILKHNDIISVENFDIRFQLIDEMLAQSFNDITDSDILEVKLLKKVLRALDRESIPSLEVLNGSAEGKKIFLTDDLAEITIGRDPTSDFPIEEYVISRKHAKIVRKWGGIIIQDLHSKNGVFVNNRRVTEEFLHDGDRLALGTIVMMFRNPKEVSIDEISKQVEKEKAAEIAVKKAEDEAAKKEESEAKEAEEAEVSAEEEDLSIASEVPPEEEQKKLVERVRRRQYPTPHKKRQRIKFSSIELSILGLGILIFIFAIVMIVNVLLS